MSTYNVEWEEVAVDLLAGLFLRVSDPNSLWPAQHRADQILGRNPTQGTELSEGLWQLIESPLKIFYEIHDAERVVVVTHVDLV
jgi:hypothetical protein